MKHIKSRLPVISFTSPSASWHKGNHDPGKCLKHPNFARIGLLPSLHYSCLPRRSRTADALQFVGWRTAVVVHSSIWQRRSTFNRSFKMIHCPRRNRVLCLLLCRSCQLPVNMSSEDAVAMHVHKPACITTSLIASCFITSSVLNLYQACWNDR